MKRKPYEPPRLLLLQLELVPKKPPHPKHRRVARHRGHISGFGSRRDALSQREGKNPRLRGGPHAPGVPHAAEPSGGPKRTIDRKAPIQPHKIERKTHTQQEQQQAAKHANYNPADPVSSRAPDTPRKPSPR